jgi:hypothetical protein
MQLDQQHFQLIFNVIALTAITSLASICYLLKRDKDELLASKLDPPREPTPHRGRDLVAPAPPAVPRQQAAPEQRATVRKEPLASPAPVAAPAKDPDIRRFVTQRAQGWVAPSESQWKTP